MPPHFLDWTTDALEAAAGLLLDYRGAEGVADLSEIVVVVPGGRAGRRLKELLVEQAAVRSLRLVPPRVTTVGQLPELLFEPRAESAGRSVSTLAWARAARSQPRERLERLYGAIPPRGASAEWGRIGTQLRALHREVAGSGRSFHDVAALVRRTVPGESGRDEVLRWEALSHIQDAVLESLEEEGLVDPDVARIDALRGERVRADGEVWLVGVTELTPITREMLARIRGQVRSLVHAPESRRDDFDDLGCLRVERWAGARVDLDPREVRIVDRPADQAVEVARAMDELARGLPPEDVVIGAPDPEVIPYVEERLASLGVATRDGAGRDLRRTAPFRLLGALADLLQGRRWQALAAFVRHPDVERWVEGRIASDPESSSSGFPPGGWLEALDRWYNEHLPAEVPGEFGARGFQGRAGEHGEAVATLLRLVGEELLGELAAAPERRSLSAWVEPSLNVLERVYGDRPLDTSDPRDRELARALAELASVLQRWDRLPGAFDEPWDAGSALKLFLESAGQISIPFAHAPEAVEILGWLELHLDDAPVTLVVGVNAPYLPESAQGEPFLSEALRVEMGLEHNALRHARELYRLTAMKASGRRLRLIGGRRSGEGDRLRPSPLLLADSRTERVARRLLHFYGGEDPGSEGEPDPNRAPPETIEGPRHTPRASSFRLPPEPALDLPPFDALSVTDFRRLLTDPYRFALERGRSCEELHDREREMTGALFGTLAHDVLEAFGRHPAVESSDPDEVWSALEDALDEKVRARFGADGRFAQVTVRLQIEQLRSRLRRFAAWHADWIRRGWAVQGVECRTPKGGAPLEVDGLPMGIRARVDRVDYHAGEGRWAVFDYKTTDAGEDPESTHRKGRGEAKRWIDLQLPLYRWLLPRLVDADGEPLFPGADGDPVEVGYIRLPRDLDAVGASMAGWGDDDFAEALEVARDVVRTLRSGPVAFNREVRPTWLDPAMDALLGRSQLERHQDDDQEDT
ncbi:MAG: PD-(D/E)XK nuclease family protein [Gemmatimonadota bacterium]